MDRNIMGYVTVPLTGVRGMFYKLPVQCRNIKTFRLLQCE